MIFINKIRRYPLSNIFLFIGMIIAYTAFISGGAIVDAMQDSAKIASNYSYDSEMIVQYQIENEEVSLEELLCNEKMNIELPDYMATIGVSTRLIQICLVNNEDIPYDLQEGRYPTASEIDDKLPVINIGIGLKEYTYSKNGSDYIQLDGIEYKVVGYFGNDNTDLINKLVYVHFNCLSDIHKESVMAKSNYLLRYGSNSINVNEHVREIINSLSENVSYGISNNDAISVGKVEDNTWKTIFFLISAFAVAICVIVSELWIYERREEITILKISGLSNVYICKRIYKEFLLLAVISSICASLVNVLCGMYLDDFDIHIDTGMFSVIIIMLFLSSVIIFAFPVYKIYKTTPFNALGEMKK